MIEKYIFDFDGTLVDSMKHWSQKMTDILERRKISYPENIIKIITPLGDIGTAKYFKEQFGISQSVEELLEEMDEYALPQYHYHIQAKETVKETLTILKTSGYSLNVLTASPHRMLDICLQRLELYDLFDNVWSCDDFSTTKSDIQIYHMVAERLHTTVENCFFFDDNVNALSTAKKAGMKVIGVYDESSEDDKEVIEEVCEMYIHRFKEIL